MHRICVTFPLSPSSVTAFSPEKSYDDLGSLSFQVKPYKCSCLIRVSFQDLLREKHPEVCEENDKTVALLLLGYKHHFGWV